MAGDRHPGITMHKLPVGGGFIGALFAIGCSLIFVIGFPTLWYFVALAFGLGIGVALLLRLMARRSSDRNKPLSILGADRKEVVPAPEQRKTPGNLHHFFPAFGSR